ncbi:histidine phosphatase family protein, partial [Rhizobium ruizarguesonis]
MLAIFGFIDENDFSDQFGVVEPFCRKRPVRTGVGQNQGRAPCPPNSTWKVPLLSQGSRGYEPFEITGAGRNLAPSVKIEVDDAESRRAKETWKLVRGALSKKVSEREAADIYEVSAERILDVIRAVEPGIRTLLIVGHNHGMENAASLIVADGDADAVGRMQ